MPTGLEQRVFEGSGSVGQRRFVPRPVVDSRAAGETRRARALLLAGNYGEFAKVPSIAATFYRNGAINPTFNFSAWHQRTIGPSLKPAESHLANWDRVEVVPWTLAELRRLYAHFFKSGNDWCTGKRMQAVLAGQQRRLADTASWVHRGAPFSHASMRLNPVTISDCQAEPKKAIEGFAELAAVAAVAVAAAYLAPALTGAGAAAPAAAAPAGTVTATGAAGAGAGASAAGGITAGTVGTAGGITGAVQQALAVGQQYAGTAETVINSARMVDAVAKGEMPPPPISLADGNFTDYASAVGKYMLEQQMDRQATDAEARALEIEAENARRWLAANEQPHAPIVNSNLPPLLQHAQRASADAAIALRNAAPWIIGAGGVLVLLLLRQRT